MPVKFWIFQAPFEQTSLGYEREADYAQVWEGEVEAHEVRETMLEAIWTSFQRVDPETGPWPPEGYEGRSLSIGDVVVLQDGDALEAWSPTRSGWQIAALFTQNHTPSSAIVIPVTVDLQEGQDG